jgi:hypothetical protein
MRLFCRLLFVCVIDHAARALADTTEPTVDRTLIAGGPDLVR